MTENASACGAGNSYCFTFTTRTDTAPCTVGSVLVAPNPFYAHDEGEKTDYGALPLAKEDACIVLLCKAYPWSWGTAGNCPSCATVTHNPDLSQNPPVGEACEQTVTSQLETGTDPVKIEAETSGVKGSGDYYVNFIPPKVISYGPNCKEACVNAAVWAVFNVELDPNTVTASNVEVKECLNENCLEFKQSFALAGHVKLEKVYGTSDIRLRQITIEPVSSATPPSPLLLPGRYYKATLRGGTATGIRSKSGVPMTGLNDPDGFSWTFRTKIGEKAFCEVENVLVAPTEKYETMVGVKQEFNAAPFSSPDVCSEKGQQLVALGGYSWASSNLKVATLLQDGTIDTGAPLPSGCSGTCKLVGASGKAGKTAQCGNGIVETTNGAYCLSGGKTVWNQTCLLLPPDGKGGEECDDANDVNEDACSNTCLWNLVKSTGQGGTCGNAVLNAGEDCDFGMKCQGAGATSTTPNGSDCTDSTKATECIANGGTCSVSLFRGCSPTCQHLGSPAATPPSTCGSGDLGDGEDCDDGNLASGDGCSSICLHEGSSKTTYALCGNGKFEPGEACEQDPNGPWPAPGCDAALCLHTGVQPCAASGQANCCGNGKADEPGKDCDDGNSVNGDGCNALCILEGSSSKYPAPSFCSNGILETGEQCESPGPKFVGDATPSVAGGDGMVDPSQIALMKGDDEPDQSGKMLSNITAALSGKTGTGIYGLQCGFTDERMCSQDKASYSPIAGLTTNGCCSLRPTLETMQPPPNAGVSVLGTPVQGDPFPQGVCRNVLITGNFNALMDEGSLSNNFVVAKKVLADTCPSELKDVTDAIETAPKGWRGFARRLWRRVLAWFGAAPAYAQKWCAGTVTGSLQFATDGAGTKTTFFFTLDSALEPTTEYRVRFLGDTSTSTLASPLADNGIEANRWGVKTKKGTVALQDATDSGPLTWRFVTGNKICAINNLSVKDLSLEHPYFYVKSGEGHPFVAFARSIQNGIPVALSPVGEYKWEWQNWAFSNPSVIEIKPPTLTPPTNLSATSKDVAARDVSGSGYLSARLRITDDTVNIPPSSDTVVQGTAHLTVNLCENPWPSLSFAPFRDTADSPDLAETPFKNGPFYNFSLTYCRDAGETGPNGDLPGLLINPVSPNAVDSAQGIVRQYLFTYREQNLKKDAIGLRIATNPLHLSPIEWYRDKRFKGNPKPIKVDGYEAIEDGRTVYVSAANTEGPGSDGKSTDIYSNIYLISYNEGAEAVTRQLYNELLKSFSFNVNVQYDVANACEDEFGSLESGTDGLPVSCTADWQCDSLGAGKECASFKGKVQRDLVRLSDFQAVTRLLETTKKATKKYPRLATGSYLPGITTSLWPSWTQTFGQGIGGAPSKDPVNRFVTCGRCGQSKTSCITDTDCPSAGEVCVAEDGFDPLTCWNDQKKEYKCPFDPAEGPKSRLYQYRAFQAGDRFELASDFEVPPPDPSNLGANWWKPRLFEDVKRCVTPETEGNFCMTDAGCRICPGGSCMRCEGGTKNGEACAADADCSGGGLCKDIVPVVTGACLALGGSFRYVNVCTGTTAGSTGSCGDGVVDIDPTHTSCLGGPNDGKSCTSGADCGGSPCAPNEFCELTGPSSKRFAACTTADAKPGKKVQVCLDCRRYADDPKQPGCFALKQCGNGKVDGTCTGDPTVACVNTNECKPGTCVNGACSKNPSRACTQDAQCTDVGTCDKEVCDDGALNGTTGHCKANCSGYGAYCGDQQISPGEACDNGTGGAVGTNNGDYCKTVSQGGACVLANSCNLTCSGSSYHCGDSIVTAPEQCDGNTETTSKAVCQGGANDQKPCDDDAECGDGIEKCQISVSSCPGGGGSCSVTVSTTGCPQGSACAGPDGICSNKSQTSPQPADYCLKDTDCGTGNTCIRTVAKSCAPNSTYCGPNSECKGPVPYVMTRTCGKPGMSDACTYASGWSTCHPASWCGDGQVNEGEACDDGNTDDTDACTSVCKKNVCGDGKFFKGVEECDNGAMNGKACTNAEYGSTCSSCSTSCKLQLTQGGYCGDGVKNPGTPEQCDKNDLGANAASLTCKGLGYDYAKVYKNYTATNVPNLLTGGGCIIAKENPIPPKQQGFAGLFEYLVINTAILKSGTHSLPMNYLNTDGTDSGVQNPNVTVEDILFTLSLNGGSPPSSPQGFDNSKLCIGAKVTFSDDVVTCGSTCTYGGCAYCGSEPGKGIVEGLLKDSLFQQPVPNARVTLFYKGLQVDQTTSGNDGYFVFSDLDTHAGCNQYKIVADMYKDNPLTDNFDESKRGGYLPVKVGPFEPNNQSLIDVVVASKQGQSKSYSGTGDERSVAEINMLPKLGPNEYIVQFWWEPTPGDPEGVEKLIKKYRKSGTCWIANKSPSDPTGNSGKSCEVKDECINGGPGCINICDDGSGNNTGTCNLAVKGAFYGKYLNDYHDLVIRMPITYTPGTYGSCSLTPKPKAFGEDGYFGDLCFEKVDNNSAKPFTNACSSVDYGKNTNDNDERFNFVISGMAQCTNKIRATAGRTCTIMDCVKEGSDNCKSLTFKSNTKFGCSDSWDCENPAKYNINEASGKLTNTQRVKCLGPADGGKAEDARQGSLNVLNGSAGAYLFCFHPEDPAKGSDCTNFIVPPQSAFISGKGGVYDVIISQFNMLAGGAYGPQRVISWLYDHNAELRMYDKNGLYDVWNYKNVNPTKSSWPPEWGGDVLCPNTGNAGDSTTAPSNGVGKNINGAVKYPTDAGWPPKQYKALYMTIAGGVNQSWVPFSIDTTSKTVKAWNNGNQHAAYRYFGDLYTIEGIGQLGAGTGVCWYHTCSYFTGKDSSGQATKWPPVVDGAQKYLCNDGKGKYSGDPNAPACTGPDKDICVKYFGANTKTCTKTVNASVQCVKFCTNPMGQDVCTGTVKGSSGGATVEAFCGGPMNCVSKNSDLFR
ncbi:MAG TPA: hypothetical protein VN397_00680 [Candidatus Methylomirabilis sp.]|nr:hypothetical protein [Candidatus Methylomirabilis sp.]